LILKKSPLSIVYNLLIYKCSTIAVAIDENNWAEQIEANLCDVSAFNEKVVNE
jgi:hypothetical protein